MSAVAVGGVVGAEARYLLSRALPPSSAGFDWGTFTANALGCLLIGMIVAPLLDGARQHRLARPFLVTGVLGGFTTFSAYAAHTHHLLDAGHPALASLYAVATLVTALLATRLGLDIVRRARRRR